MICFTGTEGEPIHVNEKCHAVDKMNDESDESVPLSPCVYVKDEPVHGRDRSLDTVVRAVKWAYNPNHSPNLDASPNH